jgi:uncharacterized membrane protein YdbT with pleckstrin-like domain
MSFIDHSLVANEHIVTKAKLHPAIFAAPLVGLIVAVLILSTARPSTQDSAFLGRLMVILFILACLRYMLQLAVVYFTTEFAVTDKRVIGKTGLLHHHSLDMLLRKVESVEIGQSLVGRLMGYGTVAITGSGGTKQPFTGIKDPMQLRATINIMIGEKEQVQSIDQR